MVAHAVARDARRLRRGGAPRAKKKFLRYYGRNCEPDFRGKIDALGQNTPQPGPKCQGGGGITAYVVRPHAPDGAPTVGVARIGRGGDVGAPRGDLRPPESIAHRMV